MNVMINGIGFSVNPVLQEFITKKLSKLAKYNEDLQSVTVTLKLEKDDAVGNKLAEVSLSVKGCNPVFASKSSQNFEDDIDELYDILKRQLIKLKEKNS
ncbi:MAG: ribosome-associated translation inhibitor RaiA [Bacteroidales bacterium]|nr:ribosome-associated translation inhibitor RaiA [Bacteroidales bacterium]MBR2475017.1 ribosome-associated translation inhibitor RaiA [Bacteroidaceae bacterium]